MKSNNFFKRTGIFSIVLLTLFSSIFTSCLKDKGPAAENNYSNSPALVGFQYKGFSSVPYVASILGTPTDTVSVEVTLSVASITIDKPVTVTVIPYAAGLDSFNVVTTAADTTVPPTDYQQLDPSMYTLQNGGVVTIMPGQQFATLRINFAGDKIDYTKQNGIGLKISDASGYLIASNLSTAIVTVTLRSQYEGNYHVSGVRIHPTLGEFDFDYDADLSTVDASTVTGSILADLMTDLTIHINPDNTVTLSSVSFPPFLQAGKDNKYDPATKTFYLNYYYNSGAPRLITETIQLN